jgi:hypothetical protein
MSTDPTLWSTVIQSWYNENEDFVYGVGAKPNSAVGHYTQVSRADKDAVVTNILSGNVMTNL